MTSKLTITDERVISVIERLEHYACNLKWTNVRGAQDLLTAADGLRELQERRKAAMDSEPECLPLDYLQGHKDGLDWASQLAEANHPDTGDWLYDDPIELAKAIRKGPDMPPAQSVDSEPVAWQIHTPETGVTYVETNPQSVENIRNGYGIKVEITPLYRHAQPAPVVPEVINKLLAILDRHTVQLGWGEKPITLAELVITRDGSDELEACHAAMLQGGNSPALTVWYGDMPETNGKTNWTAILHRKGECLSTGITIDRSEYPDRVRYEADRMRYLIGELEDEPDILEYDADAHSGYVPPAAAPGNSPVIPDCWTGNDKANAALMMLDRIETVDPVDDDRIDGIKRIIHELAAAITGIPVIPDGYVMVPKDPTQAMCAAFNDSDYGRKSLRERYVAMLAAAPQEVK